MKRAIALTFIVALCLPQLLIGGGIVTNTNQSAEFIRMMNRNASTDLDAVYYNPAGLTHLEEGKHLYASNQIVIQTREIVSTFPGLNQGKFSAETNVPFYPNIYAAYKMGDLTISAGLMPIGGGGSAEYSDGLPMLERQLTTYIGLPASLLNPSLEGDITGYSLDADFSGSSIYLGGQVNASYMLSEMFSVSLGARYVSANNTYEGSLENITLLAGSTPIPASPDQLVDVKQTGSGFTGIVGLNVSPCDKLNLGLRYELKTSLELTNETTADSTGMFPDGQKTGADIPATLAAGAAYSVLPELNIRASFTYFFNEDVDWDGAEALLENGTEYGVGVEYGVTSQFMVSAGYLISNSGATLDYQSELSYSLDAQTIGVGGQYTLSPGLAVGLGVSSTSYDNAQKTLVRLGQEHQETYKKTSTVYSLGVSYSLP